MPGCGLGATAWAGAAGFGGGGIVALTAVLQAGDRLATFFCRQASASRPPGLTPEHFDMKSERQDERMALCWADVSCAAAPSMETVSVKAAAAKAAIPGSCVFKKVMALPDFGSGGAAMAAPFGAIEDQMNRRIDPIIIVFACKSLPKG
jgi:hypothetical protein